VRLRDARRHEGERTRYSPATPKSSWRAAIESMSNAPYLLPKARAGGGYRMGNQEVLDHMFFDGLQSPWTGQLMGCFADNTSDKYGLRGKRRMTLPAESVRRALAA